MAKYFKRVFGNLIEEPLLIQIKVLAIAGSLPKQDHILDLYLSWKRGETQERSAPFGEAKTTSVNFDLAITFNKLSIFYKNTQKSEPVYQSKSSLISIQGLSDQKKEVSLGSADFDLAKYVGRIHSMVDLKLNGGMLTDGTIKLCISVVTIPKANLVGVDPMSLLDGVPPAMKDILSI